MGQGKTFERSLEHAPFVAMLPDYFRRVEQQEAEAVVDEAVGLDTGGGEVARQRHDRFLARVV